MLSTIFFFVLCLVLHLVFELILSAPLLHFRAYGFAVIGNLLIKLVILQNSSNSVLFSYIQLDDSAPSLNWKEEFSVCVTHGSSAVRVTSLKAVELRPIASSTTGYSTFSLSLNLLYVNLLC